MFGSFTEPFNCQTTSTATWAEQLCDTNWQTVHQMHAAVVVDWLYSNVS